jgi:hypothetical protein
MNTVNIYVIRARILWIGLKVKFLKKFAKLQERPSPEIAHRLDLMCMVLAVIGTLSCGAGVFENYHHPATMALDSLFVAANVWTFSSCHTRYKQYRETFE